MAAATAVPVGTLKDWLRAPRSEAPPSQKADEAPSRTRAAALDDARIQSVLEAWHRWHGSFVDFCAHVHDDLRIGIGRDPSGASSTKGCDARRVERDAHPRQRALRDAFKTSPGAQWVGDGMQVPVVFDGRRFVFNVELNVDAHTAAFVGASVRDAEDSEAVVDAFKSGVATTGALPLAQQALQPHHRRRRGARRHPPASARPPSDPKQGPHRGRLRPLLAGPAAARLRHDRHATRQRARRPRAARRGLRPPTIGHARARAVGSRVELYAEQPSDRSTTRVESSASSSHGRSAPDGRWPRGGDPRCSPSSTRSSTDSLC